MQVIYRITDIPSTNESPILAHNKKQLNKLCLRSFLHAFSDVPDKKIHFICDGCSEETLKMIGEVAADVDFSIDVVSAKHRGINSTMVRAYAYANNIADDYVLFQECDYIYRGTIGSKFISALSELDIVSPYDHPNFYIDRSIHSEDCKIRLIDGVHYRTAERNTMTWGCHSSLIHENFAVLCFYGYLDNKVWDELREVGIRLWTPIPSFATHMVKDWLAPSINWKDICQNIQ